MQRNRACVLKIEAMPKANPVPKPHSRRLAKLAKGPAYRRRLPRMSLKLREAECQFNADKQEFFCSFVDSCEAVFRMEVLLRAIDRDITEPAL